MVASLRQSGGPAWVNWFCDAPPVGRGHPAARRRVRRRVRGRPARRSRRSTTPGNPPVHYLPAGCDPSIHRPMRARDRFRANVVFVGHGHAAPRAAARGAGGVRRGGVGAGLAADQAAGLLPGRAAEPRGLHPGLRRRVGGGQRGVRRRQARGRADPGASRRLFELAAIGVPQVVEEHPDIHRHFREGSEILVARIAGELRTLTAEALHDRAWAEQVAAGARQRALAEHTYMHRLRALLQRRSGGGRVAGAGASREGVRPARLLPTTVPPAASPSPGSPGYIRTYPAAIVRWVKWRSTRARQASGSSPSIAGRSATSSSTESPSAPDVGRDDLRQGARGGCRAPACRWPAPRSA